MSERCNFQQGQKGDDFIYKCKKCGYIILIELRFPPARICSVQPQTPKQQISPQAQNIIAKAARATKAFSRWVRYGKPERTELDIDTIYERICTPCPHFTGDSCELCGCYVNKRGGKGIYLNKLRLGTEFCPDTPARWHADIMCECSNCKSKTEL